MDTYKELRDKLNLTCDMNVFDHLTLFVNFNGDCKAVYRSGRQKLCQTMPYTFCSLLTHEIAFENNLKTQRVFVVSNGLIVYFRFKSPSALN